MARRSSNYRKSTSDIMDSDNPFQTMYSQAFVDPATKRGASKVTVK